MNDVPQNGARRTSFLQGLGVREAIGVSLAGMGPTLAMNLNPQEPSQHVGRLIPLVFLLSTVLVIMVAWCFARLSRLHPNAGSAFGFVSAVMGPRAGLVAGWALLGSYLCFGMVGISAFGLFRGDLAAKFHPAHHPSVFFFTLVGTLLVAALSVTVARLAALALITLEGVAVAVMLALSAAVIWQVLHGHGPQGDPPIRDLFIPSSEISPSAITLALSFGFLSFAGFEMVATMGEEVRRPTFTIPRVLLGTVIGGGVVYTFVTTAEVLGFGTDPVGMARFAASHSLLGDLGGMYFGRWCGDLLDILATFSALGCGLASVMGASRVLFAMLRELAPSSRLAQLSAGGSSPVLASLCVIGVAFAGYAAMRLLFHASGSVPFFWASTLGVLGLLVAYLLVVLSAGLSLLRDPSKEGQWQVMIPAIAALSIGYTLWVNVYPAQQGAYGVIPWIVLGWCLLPVFLMGAGMIRR
ncbi:MAG: APC family permease [bacterium]